MRAHVVALRNPYAPLADREVIAVRRPRRIRALARVARMDDRRPYICTVNGAPLLRAQWDRCVADGDVVAFVALPQGGKGGSQVLAIVAMLALAVISGPAAGAIVGATQGAAYAAVQAAIMVAGGALISSLTQPSRGTTPQRAAELAAASPTYTLSAQGNAARLGQPIPVPYGLNRLWPDFAAAPYAEFIGNEQYLYQLHCVGQGRFVFTSLQIEDSVVQANPIVGGAHLATGAFPEIAYEIVEPGGTVTLFPANVVTSGEISGQEIVFGSYVGPFVVSGAGMLANAIAVDIVCSRGLYYANDSGGLDAKLVQIGVEAQAVDVNGNPAGAWFGLGVRQVGPMATTTPQRESFRFDVAPGRYQVRVHRLDTKDTRARAGHEVNWTGLRAYLPSEQQYGAVTLLALRMRASNFLSETSARRVNVIATRKLHTWAPGAGWSAGEVPTRSIAWALADACRSAYGGDLADDRYDVGQLWALDQTWAVRGDTFDFVFDSRLGLWEVLEVMARCGRATRFLQGGVIRWIRDQARTIPVQVFSRRNVVAGSLEREYLMPGPEDAEGIEVEYWDQTRWAPAVVRCQAAGAPPARWAKIKLPGVSQRDQAWREGMYQLADHLYRRMRLTFAVELEGHLCARGDYAALSWDIPGWGLSCDLEACTGINGAGGIDIGATLTLSERYEWAPGYQHYVAFRRSNGALAGPYLVTQGADDRHLVLAQGVSGFQPALDGTRERTHVLFGPGAQQYIPIRILETRPRGGRVEVLASNEDPAVHLLDQGIVPPPVGGWALPGPLDKPTIPGALIVRLEGTVEQPALVVSWTAAPGARSYLVELSRDGTSWTRAAEVTTTHVRVPVARGTGFVRVAPMGLLRGAWVSAAYDTETLGPLPPDPTDLVLVAAFAGREVAVRWTQTARTDYYIVHVRAGGVLRRTVVVDQAAQPRYTYTEEQARQDGGPFRSVTIRVWSANGAGQSANYAELTASNPAPAAPLGIQIEAGYQALFVQCAPPVDADVIGLKVWWSTSAGFTPSDAGQVIDSTMPTMAMIPGLEPGVKVYMRLAHYDVFGKAVGELTLSSEVAGTPGGTSIALFDRDNMILNGGAEEGLIGWQAAAGLLESSTEDHAEGSRCWKLSGAGGQARSRAFPVHDGQYYLVRMRARGTGTGTGFRLRLAFGGADTDGFVGLSGAVLDALPSSAITGGWLYYSGIVQVPAASLWASLYVDRGTAPAIFFDGVEVRRQITSVEIGNDQVTAPKIQALAINTYHFNGRIVNAEHINVARLDAIVSNMGSLTTGMIDMVHNGYDGGWGFLRSVGKWWRQGGSGWVMARHGDGSVFYELQSGHSALRMSSWGDNELHFADGLGNEQLHVDSSGNARFAGQLVAASGSFRGALQAATGTFSGTLTADAINAVSELNIAGEAVTGYAVFQTGPLQGVFNWQVPPGIFWDQQSLNVNFWTSGNRPPVMLFQSPLTVLGGWPQEGHLWGGVELLLDGLLLYSSEGGFDYVSQQQYPITAPTVLIFPYVPARGYHNLVIRGVAKHLGGGLTTAVGTIDVYGSRFVLMDFKR